MNVLIKRGAALLMGWLLGLLGRWGVAAPAPEMSEEVERWMEQSLELLLDLAVLGLSGWLKGRGSAVRGTEPDPPGGGG